MADLNKTFLIGRLTADPELRYTPGGAAVADLRLATNRTWTGKDGEKHEDVLYIDVVVWNRTAEACCQYLKKGSATHIEGYMKLEKWETKEGEKRSKIKVEAERVQFLDSKRDQNEEPEEQEPRQNGSTSTARAPSTATRPVRGRRVETPRPSEASGSDEDIPY